MRTLLITDDQEGVLHTLAYVFGTNGYRTLLAKSGPAALEIARTERLDGALIDLHMPVMDGFTVCRTLTSASRETGRTLPVWLMTGAFTAAAVAKAAEVGAMALLKKPFDFAELIRDFERCFAGDLPTSAPAPIPRTDETTNAA